MLSRAKYIESHVRIVRQCAANRPELDDSRAGAKCNQKSRHDVYVATIDMLNDLGLANHPVYVEWLGPSKPRKSGNNHNPTCPMPNHPKGYTIELAEKIKEFRLSSDWVSTCAKLDFLEKSRTCRGSRHIPLQRLQSEAVLQRPNTFNIPSVSKYVKICFESAAFLNVMYIS